MARIQPRPRREMGRAMRLALNYARRAYGAVPEPVAVWAHAPAVFWTWSASESAVVRSWRAVPPRLATLVELRAAAVIGCPWCLDFGSLLARSHGVTEQQLRDLHRWADSDAFDEREALALAYADAMTSTPLAVTDELVEHLREVFTTEQVVELTAFIALENQRSRFNHALGMTSQGFTTGACALPVQAEAAGLALSPEGVRRDILTKER